MKRDVTLFVSYARANKVLAARLLAQFEEQANASRHYRYRHWRDGKILAGEHWQAEVQRALDQCDLGLLLVSPAFLGSDYIDAHELPALLARDVPVVPVMLQPVDFEHHDLKGLQARQIFRLDGERLKSPKAYGECTGQQRDRFALELFRQIQRRLDKRGG